MRWPKEAEEDPGVRKPAVVTARFVGLPMFSCKEARSVIAFVHPMRTGTPAVRRMWRVSSVFSKVNVFERKGKGSEWKLITSVSVKDGEAVWGMDFTNVSEPVIKEMAATPLPYPDPLGVMTDFFKIKVYITTVHIRRHPKYGDCWCRFFGRIINVDPVKADEELHGWWRNPAWVLKIFCGDNVAVDVVPVISGITIDAYYVQSSPHWFWVLDVNVRSLGKEYRKEGIISGNMIRSRYTGGEGRCFPDVPDQYFRCAKVRYSIDSVSISQFKELGHW